MLEMLNKGDTIFKKWVLLEILGPLHSEIRENGIPTDPKKYLWNDNN